MARASRTTPLVTCEADLLAHDAAIDRAVCGVSLEGPEETRLSAQGAHDPTPSFYFVLEELFGHFSLGPDSHLLDVGCGTGRVLAHFVRSGCPGRATGVELDPELAATARAWAIRFDNLAVAEGSVLDLDLSPFTDFFLFNPFDAPILRQFIERLEEQVAHPCTVVHMSDNGDTWWYLGRPGWTQAAEGRISAYRNARGYQVKVYDYPQHYSVWHFEP